MDKIMEFFGSDFEGAHSAFRLMITCAVRCYGFMLRTLPPDLCRPAYIATADSAVRFVSVSWGLAGGTNTLSN
jgi:hypothetical protein